MRTIVDRQVERRKSSALDSLASLALVYIILFASRLVHLFFSLSLSLSRIFILIVLTFVRRLSHTN